MGGRFIKRLDNSLKIIITAIMSKLFDFFVNSDGRKYSYKQIEMSREHEESLEKRKENDLIVIENNEVFVKSSLNLDKKYLITLLKEEACDCFINCPRCQLCIHQITCECLKNQIQNNICQHIHYLTSKVKDLRSIFHQKSPVKKRNYDEKNLQHEIYGIELRVNKQRKVIKSNEKKSSIDLSKLAARWEDYSSRIKQDIAKGNFTEISFEEFMNGCNNSRLIWECKKKEGDSVEFKSEINIKRKLQTQIRNY